MTSVSHLPFCHAVILAHITIPTPVRHVGITMSEIHLAISTSVSHLILIMTVCLGICDTSTPHLSDICLGIVYNIYKRMEWYFGAGILCGKYQMV